jgi:hypothetical protein
VHPEASDREHVRNHVRRVSDLLADARMDRHIRRAALGLTGDGSDRSKIDALLEPDPAKAESSGGVPDVPGVPHMSRAPLVSMLQSHVDEAHRTGSVPSAPGARGFWHRLKHRISALTHLKPGSLLPDDPEWYFFIAIAVLGHLARGNHDFNRRPAEIEIADDARLVVVGDWGTGLPRAQEVADQMAVAITEAHEAGRQVHVVHLGDVYYSGLAAEYRHRFLRFWPVTPKQAAAGVTSWSCSGNHDMYSGGYGYFRTLLRDKRFAAQHSADRKPTSFFRLRSPSWDFVGLDTAWDSDIVSQGQIGVLEDPQAAYVDETAGSSDRKLVLFSHHQLVSVYEKPDLGPTLPRKLAGVLDSGRITGWWWGHEHRVICYAEQHGVRFPRCLGHGGVPVPPDPEPPADSGIVWRGTRTVHGDGTTLNRCGFAVFDLDGDSMQVRYIDDDGHESFRETVS